MKQRDKEKELRRKSGLIFIKMFTFLSGIISLKFSFFLGKILGEIIYLILARHRKVALESLAIAFPDYSAKRRKEITKEFFILMAKGGLELLYYLNNTGKIKQAIEIQGKENLDRALARKKGVILVSAHYGNFPLMSLRLADCGYPVNIVARPMRDKYAEAHFHSLRSSIGVKTISAYPRKACVLGIIKALAAGEIVIIQMDQNFGTGGVWVDFFGKLAATPTGPVVLSMRTQAALVPSYIYQRKDKRHLLRILPEEELVLGKNKEETILKNVSHFTKIIESWIKARPQEWSWIHRRWKSRPPKNKL